MFEGVKNEFFFVTVLVEKVSGCSPHSCSTLPLGITNSTDYPEGQGAVAVACCTLSQLKFGKILAEWWACCLTAGGSGGGSGGFSMPQQDTFLSSSGMEHQNKPMSRAGVTDAVQNPPVGQTFCFPRGDGGVAGFLPNF